MTPARQRRQRLINSFSPSQQRQALNTLIARYGGIGPLLSDEMLDELARAIASHWRMSQAMNRRNREIAGRELMAAE